MSRLGIGPGPGFSGGTTFKTSASDLWEPGQEFTTWAGYKVVCITRTRNLTFGSWKYDYEFKIILANEKKSATLESKETKV